MRVGIFFGGPSREREISFSGGKTAFEYLDKSLFELVPVFVDSLGRFIKLVPDLMYSTQIRDFYPSASSQTDDFKVYIESLPELAGQSIPGEIGEEISPSDFKKYFDFAFLAMHGPDCEDGAIQGLLEWYRVPYSGPGLMGSAVGIDKILQNEMIALVNGQQKKSWTLRYSQWVPSEYGILFQVLKKHLGLPLVMKAPHQGSSIGVAIVKEDSLEQFIAAVNQCFFQTEVIASEWKSKTPDETKNWAQKMANLDEGIGFPMIINEGKTLFHPAALITELDQLFETESEELALLSSSNAEDQILIEEFISGQEFSCGCIQFDDGKSLALPPSEVVKLVEVFDFNSKYKPGGSRKKIPVDASLEKNREIQDMIAAVFEQLGITACVRIDGFLTPEGTILLHDPNTIPGMSPTSFIFKQMAEIGLNVTQALTYLIRQSLRERIRIGKDTWALRKLLATLDEKIVAQNNQKKKSVGILFKAGEDAYVETRTKYGQLNSEGILAVTPVLKHTDGKYYKLPNPLMFKEFFSDVDELLLAPRNLLLTETALKATPLTQFFAGDVNYDVRSYSSLAEIDEIDEWVEIGKVK